MQSEYQIADAGGLQVLAVAMEAFQRCEDARQRIAKDGMVTSDRFGQLRPHPLLMVERDARSQYLAALKQLNLDVEPLHQTIGRPPGR